MIKGVQIFQDYVEGYYIVARLAEEAGIGFDPDPIKEDLAQGIYAVPSRGCYEEMVWNCQDGLWVQDHYTKKWYRLKVTAEEWTPETVIHSPQEQPQTWREEMDEANQPSIWDEERQV